jgi:hypothetical protein
LVEVSVNRTVSGAVPEITSAVKDTAGAESAVTVMYPSRLVVLLPAEFAAVSRTVNVPAPVYVYAGFCPVDVPPSPKFQFQKAGEFEDLSENLTVNGATPEV